MSESLHEKLMNSLNSLKNPSALTYLVHALDGKKINSEAEIFILLFLMSTYQHDRFKIMSDPHNQKLQRLCQESLAHSSSHSLFNTLNQPQNSAIKKIFDEFVDHYVIKMDKTAIGEEKNRKSTKK